MKEKIHIHISIDRRTVVGTMAFLLVCAGAYDVMSEKMTMTTYYPAPVGVYKNMTTTAKTTLARDSGDVHLALSGGGRVGIGTTNPGEKVSVIGNIGVTGSLLSQGDLLVKGESVVTTIICQGERITCSKSGNTVTIKIDPDPPPPPPPVEPDPPPAEEPPPPPEDPPVVTRPPFDECADIKEWNRRNPGGPIYQCR